MLDRGALHVKGSRNPANRLSVSSKLLLPILLSVGLGLALLTAFVSNKSAGIVRTLSIQAGDEMARNIAAQVEVDLTRPLQIALYSARHFRAYATLRHS